MRKKISNQFLTNYFIVFAFSITATVFAFVLLSYASGFIAGRLVKNRFSADSIMRDDFRQIDVSGVVENKGGIQVIDDEYRIILSAGLDTIKENQLDAARWTEFLVKSRSVGMEYNYDILYNPQSRFWLVVTFPTSIRIDFSFVHNKSASKRDFLPALAVVVLDITGYLLLILILSYVFSRITASGIIRSLRKLCDGTRLLREGDYSVRVDLRLKNEFTELEDTFNDMASKIEEETALRKKSEDDRRRLILDIFHDLKNPLSSVMGYAGLCLEKSHLTFEEQKEYLKIIHNNSQRAKKLLMELFEYSKLDSPDFNLVLSETELCEYIRVFCGTIIPSLEKVGFEYEFDIPEKNIPVMIDINRFERILQNLVDNAMQHNPSGTLISIEISINCNNAIIKFSDNGCGIPEHLGEEIFKPFVSGRDLEGYRAGNSGLGLSIVKKLVEAHKGILILKTDVNKGCVFLISIPCLR